MVVDRFVRWMNQAPDPPSEEAQAAVGHGKATATPFVIFPSNNQGLFTDWETLNRNRIRLLS